MRAVRAEATEIYLDWINSLRDRAGRARIQVRIERLAHGNPGKFESSQSSDIETAMRLARNL